MPPSAAVAPKQIRRIDPNTPPDCAGGTGLLGKLADVNRSSGKTQGLWGDRPGCDVACGIKRDTLQCDGLGRTVCETQAVVARDAHACKRSRKTDCGPCIAREGRGGRHGCDRADAGLDSSASTGKATPGGDRPCGAPVHEDLADCIDRPVAQRKMSAEGVAISDDLGVARPAHGSCPVRLSGCLPAH